MYIIFKQIKIQDKDAALKEGIYVQMCKSVLSTDLGLWDLGNNM